jgi:hypothetical protein
MKKLAGACIIISLMTISVGEALADCSWVAWTKNRLISTSEGKTHDEVTWEVHSAFEKRAQCVDSASGKKPLRTRRVLPTSKI